MPLMTSLTSVCAPKPTATPTTPAPAMSGPISTPRAESAVRPAMTAMTTRRILRKIGSRVRMRAWRTALSVPISAGAAAVRELRGDCRLDHLPEEIREQHHDDARQRAAHEARRQGVAVGEGDDVDAPGMGKPDGRGNDEHQA